MEFPFLKKLSEAYNSQNPPAVLLFGDSTAIRIADDDSSLESLQDLIVSGIGEAGVCSISGSAFHSQVFSLFCHCLVRLRYRPRVVVIPINLRSFSLSWDLHPDYQFLWETATLNDFAHGIDVPREPISVTPVARAIFNAVPVALPSGQIGTIGEIYEILASKDHKLTEQESRNRLATIFTFHYLYQLHANHRKLRYFGSAIKGLRREGIPVLLYITPINYQAGNTYVGPQFEKMVSKNIEVIQSFLSKLNVIMIKTGELTTPFTRWRFPLFMVNWAFDCDASEFFTPHNATEHLRYAARKRLGERIVKIVKEL